MTNNANADNGIKMKIFVFRPIFEIKYTCYKFVTFYVKQKNFQAYKEGRSKTLCVKITITAEETLDMFAE